MRPRWIQATIVLAALGAGGASLSTAYAQTPGGGAPNAGSPGGSAQPGTNRAGAGVGNAPAGKGGAQRSAGDIYKEAVRLFKKGDFEKALGGFQEVWVTEKKPKVMGNIGRCELKLGKYRDAAEHLDLFLRLDTEMTPDERKDVYDLLGEAKKHVTTLRVTVTPAGAEVFVNGESKGRAPLEGDIFVEPGRHKIEARTDKGAELTEIDTQSGAEWPVKLEVKEKVVMKPPPPPPPPSTPPMRIALLVVGSGVAVAGLGVWAGMWSAEMKKRDDLDTICKPRECPAPGASDYSSKSDERVKAGHERATLSNISTAGLVVGSAVGAATLGYLIFGSKNPAKSTGMNIVITPGGIQASGAW